MILIIFLKKQLLQRYSKMFEFRIIDAISLCGLKLTSFIEIIILLMLVK